jgi:hypothetical protein
LARADTVDVPCSDFDHSTILAVAGTRLAMTSLDGKETEAL